MSAIPTFPSTDPLQARMERYDAVGRAGVEELNRLSLAGATRDELAARGRALDAELISMWSHIKPDLEEALVRRGVL